GRVRVALIYFLLLFHAVVWCVNSGSFCFVCLQLVHTDRALLVIGWVCFAAVSAFDLCVSATSSFFASGYIGVAGVFLGFMRGSTKAALWGVLADVVVVSKLLAFGANVDGSGGAVLCRFQEGG